MNRNRSLRTLCLALCAALMCMATLLLPNAPALAAGTLEISGLTVTPSSLPATGGTVDLKGTLKNTTDKSITSVHLQVGSKELDITDTIASGASKSFTMSGISIGAGDIGHEMSLSIDWSGDGGIAGNDTKTFSVPLKTETVSLSFTRTANNQKVQKGDSVKLTYNLKNTGTAVITNLKLTDSCVDGTILQGLTLNPNESKSVTSTVVVNDEVTSIPKVEYTAGGVNKSKSLDALKITIANADISISATADKTQINAGETVRFTITLTNESAVAISNIKVTDDIGNIIRNNASIKATTGTTKQKTVITYDSALSTGRSVSFTASYTSGTETASKTSDPILVNVAGLVPGASPLALTVSVSPVALTFPGDVTFTVTVKNTSGQTISAISVNEASLGNVGSIVSLAPGGQQTLTKIATLQAPGSFTFRASGNDASGNLIEPATQDVSVTSQVGSPTPEVVNPSGSDTLSTLFIVMIVIVVLIVIAGVVLVILMIQEKRAKANGGKKPRRRRDEDWEEEDGDEEGDEDDDEMQPLDTPTRSVRRNVRQTPVMEQTQPILRSGLTPQKKDQELYPAGRRRAYTLRDEEDGWSDHRGIVEEEESKVYGPQEYEDEQPDNHRVRGSLRRPGLQEDRAPLRRSRLHDEERSENLDQLYDEDRDATSRKRPSQQAEKPQVHLKYENEDDDLPPLRPRRRR